MYRAHIVVYGEFDTHRISKNIEDFLNRYGYVANISVCNNNMDYINKIN